MLGDSRHLLELKTLNRITGFPIRLTEQETRHGKTEVSCFRHPSERGKSFKPAGRSFRPIVRIRLLAERTATNQVRAGSSDKCGVTGGCQTCDARQLSVLLWSEGINAQHESGTDFLQLLVDRAPCHILCGQDFRELFCADVDHIQLYVLARVTD